MPALSRASSHDNPHNHFESRWYSMLQMKRLSLARVAWEEGLSQGHTEGSKKTHPGL